MSRSPATKWQLTMGLLILGAAGAALAQQRGGAPGGNAPAPNPQDAAVKIAGQPPKTDTSGRPLDEQKSAPVQVVTREYDLKVLAADPKVSPTEFRGRVLWVQKCAFCHDGLGQPTYKTMGPWIDQEMVKTLTDDGMKAIIQYGTARMPAFQYGLSATQLDDILNYLKTVPATAAPTPAQLAGRSEGGNSD